jgi:hypothetical protein
LINMDCISETSWIKSENKNEKLNLEYERTSRKKKRG